MKAPLVPLGCLVAFTVCANAQYFSAGWTPGQPASTEEPSPPASAFVPAPKKTTSPLLTLDGLAGLFDISNLLTLEPVASLFASVGINITEKVALQKANFWDERVPLITDDNYADLIVNESLSAQEEQDRVWFIVISVTASKQEGISKFLDNVFDAAYNETQIAGDLPNVRWGRIDYLNVTAITTKWAIWQAPYLVVLKDRGQTLRFYKPHHLRLRESALREFLRVDGWKVTEPWATAYAPGGDREYLMDFLAIWLTRIYNVTVKLPKWLLFIISGSIASFAINLMHRPSKSTKKQEQKLREQPRQRDTAAIVTSTQSTPSSPAAKRTGAKQRKGKK